MLRYRHSKAEGVTVWSGQDVEQRLPAEQTRAEPAAQAEKVPPEWFQRAVRTPAEHLWTTCADGTRIAFRCWGAEGAPGALLVHGGGAHAGWWDHIAPLLGGGLHVAAVDLSGHGESERRPDYSLPQWAGEVAAVLVAARLGTRPILVGHSMGGGVALCAADHIGDDLGGVVVVDSPFRDLTAEQARERAARALRPVRPSPTRAEMVARFRPLPDAGTYPAWMLSWIAESSVVETPQGWVWNHDPRVRARPPLGFADVTRVGCRLAVLRAEHGMLTPRMCATLAERVGSPFPEVVLAGATHHVMLDQPLSLAAALSAILAVWSC
ncbi:MAG TPA: alpha/beta fold hydrolase [Amycolatopsis sp.]|nr:alpha/beta fold hydrolase [Amycolatopsis sp.]